MAAEGLLAELDEGGGGRGLVGADHGRIDFEPLGGAFGSHFEDAEHSN